MILEKNFLGKDAKFHHIGLAVNSILDIEPTVEKIYDPIQKVYIAFVNINGVKIELIEPANISSPISANIKKGTKLVHMCFSVINIEATIAECKKYNFIC